MDPLFKKKKNLPEVWGCQSIEILLNIHKTLVSIPSTGEIEIVKEYSFKHIIHAKYILIQTKHTYNKISERNKITSNMCPNTWVKFFKLNLQSFLMLIPVFNMKSKSEGVLKTL